jgi:1,4-dihydroxy-2-naphthoate octaprenyltransferase
MTHSIPSYGRSAWVLAIRPKTLPASISPVLVGTAIAISDKDFKGLPALAALMGSLLLQIGVNLANDYFDFRKRVDTPDRIGPTRVTQSGLIPPEHVKAAMVFTFGVVSLVGLYLTLISGWPIMAAGIASILAALAYSGGPYPLGSYGLGDLLVFCFFGIVAVCGTYYVQALHLNHLTVFVSLPIGFLITAILVVNNLRDMVTDRKAGKRTLAVILGQRGARIEYVTLLACGYLMPVLLFFVEQGSGWVLLPLVTLPLAASLCLTIWQKEGPVLNESLAGTARLTIAFSLVFSMGLLLS